MLSGNNFELADSQECVVFDEPEEPLVDEAYRSHLGKAAGGVDCVWFI